MEEEKPTKADDVELAPKIVVEEDKDVEMGEISPTRESKTLSVSVTTRRRLSSMASHRMRDFDEEPEEEALDEKVRLLLDILAERVWLRPRYYKPTWLRVVMRTFWWIMRIISSYLFLTVLLAMIMATIGFLLQLEFALLSTHLRHLKYFPLIVIAIVIVIMGTTVVCWTILAMQVNMCEDNWTYRKPAVRPWTEGPLVRLWTTGFAAQYRRSVTEFLLLCFCQPGGKLVRDQENDELNDVEPYDFFEKNHRMDTLVLLFHVSSLFWYPLANGLYSMTRVKSEDWSPSTFWAACLLAGMIAAIGHSIVHVLLHFGSAITRGIKRFRSRLGVGVKMMSQRSDESRGRSYGLFTFVLRIAGYIVLLALIPLSIWATFTVSSALGKFSMVMIFGSVFLLLVASKPRKYIAPVLATLLFASIFAVGYIATELNKDDAGSEVDTSLASRCPFNFFMEQAHLSCIPEPFTGEWTGNRYPLCDGQWGGLGVLDLALLSRVAYADTSSPCVIYGWTYVYGYDEGEEGIPFVHYHHIALNTSVISVRGSSRVRDLLLDQDIFNEVLVLQFFSTFSPVLQVWAHDILAQAISQMSLIETWADLGATDFYQPVLDYVEQVRSTHPQILLTGHSLGGLVAKIVGARTGYRAITFSAPGALLSRQKFGITEVALHKTVVNVWPRGDPVPGTDLLAGQVSQIECEHYVSGGITSKCHSIATTICELMRVCGVHKSRMYDDYKSLIPWDFGV